MYSIIIRHDEVILWIGNVRLVRATSPSQALHLSKIAYSLGWHFYQRKSNKIPGHFLDDETLRSLHQSWAYNLHSLIVYSCSTVIEVRLWSLVWFSENEEDRQKKTESGKSAFGLLYGELSSSKLALKPLPCRNIVLLWTVVMLMLCNILNWIFANKLNCDK